MFAVLKTNEVIVQQPTQRAGVRGETRCSVAHYVGREYRRTEGCRWTSRGKPETNGTARRRSLVLYTGGLQARGVWARWW
jgi:hypothetical protein